MNKLFVFVLAAMMLFALSGIARAATQSEAIQATNNAAQALAAADALGKDTAAAVAKYEAATRELAGNYDTAISLANEAITLANNAPLKASATAPAPPPNTTEQPAGTTNPPADTGTQPAIDSQPSSGTPDSSGAAPDSTFAPAPPKTTTPTPATGFPWIWAAVAVVLLGGGFVSLVAAVWYVTRKRY